MNETAIDWTDYTWNVWSGCKKVSAGCKHCYAERMAERMRGSAGFPSGFDLTIRKHKLKELDRIKDGSKVFVNSMSDFFLGEVTNNIRELVWSAMVRRPGVTFQVLTKRRMNTLAFCTGRDIPNNIWIGVTVENRRSIDRVDALVALHAPVRFVSIEPMLGPLPELEPYLDRLHWVIVGGESGSHLYNGANQYSRGLSEPTMFPRVWKPRQDRVEWVREIRDMCERYEVPFFFKQWGGPTPKIGGHELDGKTHREFPKPNSSTLYLDKIG